MILKNFKNFISENFEGFSTIGEYIEYLAKDSDFVRRLVGEFTKDIKPDVRISNSINSLDEHTQSVILKIIEDESKDLKNETETEANPYVSIIYKESVDVGGKNIFKCFLKAISALGQRDCKINFKNHSENFIGIFITDTLPTSQIQNILSRYVYFDSYIKSMSEINYECKLYFGIRNDLNLEYGILFPTKLIKFGEFLITKGAHNYIMTLDLKSASNLKKFLVNLDISKLNLISKIKSVMVNFFPGQSDNKNPPIINGDIITYGYEGVGNWDNQKIDDGELENIKSNLRTFLLQFKWSDKIQFNVVTSNNWVFINIKIK